MCMAVLVAVIVLCCYFGPQVCVLKVACVHPPPHPLPDFYEGGRQMCPGYIEGRVRL